MNLKLIKDVINSTQLDDAAKERLIIGVLAKDENVVPLILSILEVERKENKELILDSNLELNRALVTLNDDKIGKKGAIVELPFVIGEIKKHYLKWKHKIKCCFKFDDLP